MWRVWERTERERQQMSDARGREWRRKSRVSLVLLLSEEEERRLAWVNYPPRANESHRIEPNLSRLFPTAR